MQSRHSLDTKVGRVNGLHTNKGRFEERGLIQERIV